MAERIDVQEFYRGLDRAFASKDVTATMTYMENWLAQANSLNDRAGIVAVSNELGGLCRVTGQTDRAKTLYDTVLVNLEEMGLGGSEHYATALINYGDVFINAQEPLQALDYFLRAKAMLTDLELTGDYRMAALCNNISMVYRDTGEFDKAEEALNMSFNIIKGIPECQGELATTYINLGELQTRQGKFEIAKESFRRACQIFEADGGRDVHYQAACAGMAQVFALEGDRAQAEAYYKKALALIERDFGRTDAYNIVLGALNRLRGN